MNVNRKFQVRIGKAAHLVGTLSFEARGGRQHSSFAYDDSWVERQDGFPIAPSMPFAQKRYFTSKGDQPHAFAFPAPIADTCPDAWGQTILRRDGRTRGQVTTDVDFLAGVDDAARMGALRFQGEDGSFQRSATHGRPIVPPTLELDDLLRAADAIEARTETQRDIARLLGNGSSLGGARPKCTVIDADGRLLIAKFTSVNDQLPVERAEVATLKLARKAGIDVTDANIIEVSGRAVALMPRFDRGPNGRIPYISAQTMLDSDSATGGSYEAMAQAIRSHCSDPGDQLEELFSRVAFTILVSNTDDHLRNHGFVYTGNRQWGLSPAFDVNPSPDRDRRLKTPISESSGDEASIELLLAEAPIFGVKSTKADEIVAKIASIVQREWTSCAKEAGMNARDMSAFEPAFEHPERSAALSRAKTTMSMAVPIKKTSGIAD